MKVNLVVCLRICYLEVVDEQQNDPDANALALGRDLRLVNARLKRRLREEAHPGDFTPSQLAVLAHLEREGPSTVTVLARAEGVRPQSMGANVSALEAAGLVRGEPDPADGRRTLLSLTDEASQAFKAGRAAREDWLSRAIHSNLTPAEQRELATGIELIKRLTES
jgi:DNA-binding MarR family transcriptional regulator